MSEHDTILRRVILRPYRKGCGPAFTLTTYDGGYNWTRHRDTIRYTLHQSGVREPIFSGADFGSSPLHAIDSDQAVSALLSFLTLRLGDTDAEYFNSYTPRQLDFANEHAESLGAEVRHRFGES